MAAAGPAQLMDASAPEFDRAACPCFAASHRRLAHRFEATYRAPLVGGLRRCLGWRHRSRPRRPSVSTTERARVIFLRPASPPTRKTPRRPCAVRGAICEAAGARLSAKAAPGEHGGAPWSALSACPTRGCGRGARDPRLATPTFPAARAATRAGSVMPSISALHDHAGVFCGFIDRSRR
jgi:hypothetical protein